MFLVLWVSQSVLWPRWRMSFMHADLCMYRKRIKHKFTVNHKADICVTTIQLHSRYNLLSAFQQFSWPLLYSFLFFLPLLRSVPSIILFVFIDFYFWHYLKGITLFSCVACFKIMFLIFILTGMYTVSFSLLYSILLYE